MRRLFPLVRTTTVLAPFASAQHGSAAFSPSIHEVGRPQKMCGVSPTLRVAARMASTQSGSGERDVNETESRALSVDRDASEDAWNGNDENVPSTEVLDEEHIDEDFDELEAASQEVHDLCYGMIAFLRRADPDGTKDLYERRVKQRIREPVPEQRRRLIHGHGDRTIARRNTFRSSRDMEEATQLYFQLGEKLMLLLNDALMDRLLHSAGKGFRDMRSDGVHKYAKPLNRASWRTFPHRWFKHAPFEVQQLRADIPKAAVLNTRFYRDHATLRYLFTLMEPQHPYRAQIEKRMFEITSRYDPATLSRVMRQTAP